MKRFFIIVATALAGLLAAGCDTLETNPGAVAPSARLIQSELIPWSGSDGFLVSITATVPVKAEIPETSWLTYYGIEMTSRSTLTYALIFDAKANPDKSERSVTVGITAEDGTEPLLTFELVQAAAEDPSVTVGEVPVFGYAGGEVSLSVTANVPYAVASSENWLSALKTSEGVTLTAKPNDELEPRSCELSFSYDEKVLATLTVSQKGHPGSGIELERVWGKYTSSDADWFTQIGAGGADQDRFIAMDKDNIYVSLIANNNPGDTWGIAVIDRATGAFKKRMAEGAGIEKVGLWAVSALQVVDDGNGGSVLIACNMSRSAENNILKIYAWKDIDSAPQKVTYSYADTHATSRLGDKMGVRGNWLSGELYFVDYFATGSARPMLIFPITNGTIASTPIDTQFGSILTGSSNFATLGYLDGDNYIYYGSSNDEEFYCCTVTRSGGSFSDAKLRLLPSRGFDGIMNGLKALTISDSRYLLWVTALRNADRTARTSYVKTIQLEGDTFSEGIAALNGVSDAQSYPLSDPELTSPMGRQNGNYTGDMATWKVGDDWYVAALGTGSGISLFKIKVK